VTQSVELVLDAAAEAAVRGQWAQLAEAGLPTEQRTQPSASHRPHLTLYAADALDAAADAGLAELVALLPLRVRVGSVLLFGPRRRSFVMVRQVVPSWELLQLQAAVAALCDADPRGQFGAGRWSPHVTLARRVQTDQVGAALQALGDLADLEAVALRCRRWDSDRRETWWVGAPAPAPG